MEQIQESFNVRMRGCVELAFRDAIPGSPNYGQTVRRVMNKNAVASQGIAWMLLHMLSGEAASAQVLQQLALGTDTTAPATTDTALGSEIARKAVGTWDTAGLTATDGAYFRAVAEFGTDEANGTLAEAALMNSSAGGTMLVHATYSTQEKATSNTLGVTYTVTAYFT